ncbi:HAD-IC family P-type ATPase [Nocardia sp. NPDC004068]|uniref:HAD-IC family P-type ATPase n=1 Tax=Nocardia sp. NPDC004068 TaxID=3364303 RepID=UPI0036C46F6E
MIATLRSIVTAPVRIPMAVGLELARRPAELASRVWDPAAEFVRDPAAAASRVLDPAAELMRNPAAMASRVLDPAAELMRTPATMAARVLDPAAELVRKPAMTAARVLDPAAELMRNPAAAASRVLDPAAELMRTPATVAARVLDPAAELMRDPAAAASRVLDPAADFARDSAARASRVLEPAAGFVRRPVGWVLDAEVGEVVGELGEGVGREIGALFDPRRLRRQRRISVRGNRIHAEVRGLRGADGGEVGGALRGRLGAEPGVEWVRVNAATGHVTVAGEALSPGRLETLLEKVEEVAGTAERPWSRTVEHPADVEPVLNSALQLAGDVIGLGAALAGRTLPLPPPANVLRATVGFVDGQPRVRGLLEAQLGRHRTDTVITVGNALSQAMDSQVTSLLADAVQRSVRLVEAGARYAQWRRWDDRLADPDQPGVPECRTPGPRPVPLPRGPVERSADEVSSASTLVSAATLTGGRGVRDAADAVAAGVPKAARAGREVFAGTLATAMSARGVLTIDPLLWRRLDRVSAIVVDRHAVRGERSVVLAADSATDDWPTEQVWSATQRLLWRNGHELPIPPPRGRRRADLELVPEDVPHEDEHGGIDGKRSVPGGFDSGEVPRANSSEEIHSETERDGDVVATSRAAGDTTAMRLGAIGNGTPPVDLEETEEHQSAAHPAPTGDDSGTILSVETGDVSGTNLLEPTADSSGTTHSESKRTAGHGQQPTEAVAGDDDDANIDIRDERCGKPCAGDVPEPGDPRWYLLRERGRTVGRVLIGREPHPDAVGLLAAARKAGLRVVLIGDEGTGELRRSADEFVRAGVSVTELVRRMQRQGHVVAVLSTQAHRGLGAADLGIGMLAHGDGGTLHVPWQADVVCPDLGCARVIIAAAGRAREVSERGRVLTLSAATLAGLLLAAGPAGSRPARATSPIWAATFLGLTTGFIGGRRAASSAPPTRVPLVPWHALEADEVLSRLPSPKRLAPPPPSRLASVGERLAGRCAAPAATLIDLARHVRRELADPMTPLLAVGAVASALLGSPTDALLVGSVLGLNAVVSAAQRRRARMSLHRLLVGERLEARVIADGAEKRLPATDLRPGDVIALSSGEVVPADARLLETDGLEVDESGLTGESVTVEKRISATPGAALADRSCMVFEGSVIVNGTARAVVVAVGSGTEAGRALAVAGPPPTGGVQAQLHSLTERVLPFTLSGGTAVTAASFLRGLPLRPALADGLAVAVAAVPEGLPLVATVAQLAATRRLSRRGVLVRSSRTIEALGRVDTVCFDKTGTLTEGRLRLVALGDLDDDWDADRAEESAEARRLLRAAARACPNPADGPLVHATDRAVVEAADTALGEQAAHTWDPIEEVPFESYRGYAAAIGHTAKHLRLAVKGAPEVLLPRCEKVLRARGSGRRVQEFTADDRTVAEEAVRRMAARGLRVLVVARRDFATAPDDVTEEIEQLTLLGFIGIADSPRPQARQLVEELAHNGIGVRMITGDHPITARAIAEQLGIPAETVVTGADIDALDEDAQGELIEHATVFARVSPEHKVRIVSALQRHGHAVAMAGDGSNDAAAIRTADVGIGLAARGSVAAREAADLILTQPDSGSDLTVLRDALAEGRGMWQRVRDAIGVLVGGNAGEVTFTVLGTLLSGRAPIGTRQFLVVNLLTDLGPAMAVALSGHTETEDGTLGPPPEIGGDFLRAVAVRGACTTAGAGAAWLIGRYTGRRRRAETMALAALIGTQLGQTLMIGRDSRLVWATVAGSGALLAGIIMTPGVSRFFGCVPLGPVAWMTVVGCAVGGTAASVLAGRAAR